MQYFGFAVSDSMFTEDLVLSRINISIEEVKTYLEGEVNVCLNPSHKATIEAMAEKFGLSVQIPETAPRCSLSTGDSLVVMQVRGLPRLDATRHEYSEGEIAQAIFTFAKWEVIG